MVRWALYASVGDVLAPLVTALAMALGFSYRGALTVVAVLVVAQCAGVASAKRDPLLDEAPPSAPEEPEAGAAGSAPPVRRLRLWAWLFAAAMCTLLDELVVALAALRLQREEGLTVALAAAATAAFSAGAVLGGWLTDRAVARLGSRRVLLGSAALCALAVGALLGSRAILPACVALFAVGVTCAPHHPLALARAYDEMPGDPGAVQAAAQLFVVIDVAAPLALGFAADRLGLRFALGCLAVQPAVVALLALVLRPRYLGTKVPT
jgi:MFS family permease